MFATEDLTVFGGGDTRDTIYVENLKRRSEDCEFLFVINITEMVEA